MLRLMNGRLAAIRLAKAASHCMSGKFLNLDGERQMKPSAKMHLVILGIAAFILGVFQTALAANTNLTGNSIQVADYGAIGNGLSDDRESTLRAFVMLLSQKKPATLYFSPDKLYYLKRQKGARPGAIFTIDGKQNLTIDGQGATVILDHFDSAFFLSNNKNISIKNLKFDYITPTFTQGKVVGIKAANYLDIEVSPGYPMPNPSAAKDFANSATFDSTGNFLRNINIFIHRLEVAPSGTTANTLRIYPEEAFLTDISKLKLGYLFVFRTYAHPQGRLFNMNKNNGVTLQNLSVYGTMGGSFLATENEGELVFDHIQIMRKSGSDRLVVGLADGIHVFDNRALVTIKNCLIERLLDDGINIGSMAEVSPNIISSRELDLRSTSNGNSSPELRPGDTVSAYNLGGAGSSYFLGSAKITEVKTSVPRVRRVVLDKPISGMRALSADSGNLGGQNLKDMDATRFFVSEIANPEYIIVNNVIRDKQRNGILAKGSYGLIRGNRLENLSGNGISTTNILKFNEGSFATDIEISANQFDGIAENGVVIGLSSNKKRPRDTVPVNATIVNNVFNNLDSFAVKMTNASDINIAGNEFPKKEPKGIVNSTNITAIPLYSLFKVATQDGVYFSSGLSYCKYEKESNLSRIWGEDYAKYVTNLKAPPNGRRYTGACNTDEGMFVAEDRTMYRRDHDGNLCKFGSIQSLQSLTGYSTGDHMKRNKLPPTEAVRAATCNE